MYIVAKKLYLHPFNLKSKFLRPRRGKRVQEHFDCCENRGIRGFFMCLRENLERKRERISLGNAPKLPNFVLFYLRGVWGYL